MNYPLISKVLLGQPGCVITSPIIVTSEISSDKVKVKSNDPFKPILDLGSMTKQTEKDERTRTDLVVLEVGKGSHKHVHAVEGGEAGTTTGSQGQGIFNPSEANIRIWV